MVHQSKARVLQDENVRIQEFLDMIVPSIIKFNGHCVNNRHVSYR